MLTCSSSERCRAGCTRSTRTSSSSGITTYGAACDARMHPYTPEPSHAHLPHGSVFVALRRGVLPLPAHGVLRGAQRAHALRWCAHAMRWLPAARVRPIPRPRGTCTDMGTNIEWTYRQAHRHVHGHVHIDMCVGMFIDMCIARPISASQSPCFSKRSSNAPFCRRVVCAPWFRYYL